MNLKDLKKPFPKEDIEWRIQQGGVREDKPWALCLAYVTSRAIMDRLDGVCGPQNWKNEFVKAPDGGIICKISIKCGDEWVTKEDGAENTAIEAVKGGLSSAMKRAGVQWGIGRYLYKLDTGWANFNKNGKNSYKDKQGKYHKWDAPALPDWALPKTTKKENKKVEVINVDQATELRDLMKEHKIAEPIFCKTVKINKLEELAFARYDGAVKWLKEQ